MTRVSLAVLFAVLGVFGVEAAHAKAACQGCNVVLISLDTLSASHLGVYGSQRKTSPNIDRFAADARVYKNAFSVTSWTLPSHGAMLTGYSPSSLKMWSMTDALPSNVPTLASILKQNGYETAAWTGGHFVTDKYGFDRGFDSFAVVESMLTQGRPFKVGLAFDKAMEWLPKRKTKKPFFLFLHTYEVHEPHAPTPESLSALDPSNKRKAAAIDIKRLYKLRLGREAMAPGETEDIKLLYDAGVMDVDRELGRFFAELKRLKLDDNTMIVLTSDHGQELGEHGCWSCHGHSVFDEVLRVPLIVRIPGAPGKDLRSPVTIEDVTPTILAALSLAPVLAADGRTLPEVDTTGSMQRPVFATSPGVGETAEGLRDILDVTEGKKANFPALAPLKVGEVREFHPFRPLAFGLSSVRAGNFKLVVDHAAGSSRLYDLAKDPGETTDVTAKESAKASELKTQLLLSR